MEHTVLVYANETRLSSCFHLRRQHEVVEKWLSQRKDHSILTVSFAFLLICLLFILKERYCSSVSSMLIVCLKG